MKTTNYDGVTFHAWLACFDQACLEHLGLGLESLPDVRTRDLFESDDSPDGLVDEFLEYSTGVSYADWRYVGQTARRKYEAHLDYLAEQAEKLADKREKLCREKLADIGYPNLPGQRVTLTSGYPDYEPVTAETWGINSISWEQVKPDEEGEFFVPNYLSGSDYSGTTVELSNFRVWTEEIDPENRFTIELYGGYGSFGVAVNLRRASREAIETLAQLADYPIISDDHHSQLELDLENEAWENDVKDDFARELGVDFRDADPVEVLECFLQAKEAANEEWIHETSTGPFIRIKPIALKVGEVPEGTRCAECDEPMRYVLSHECPEDREARP